MKLWAQRLWKKSATLAVALKTTFLFWQQSAGGQDKGSDHAVSAFRIWLWSSEALVGSQRWDHQSANVPILFYNHYIWESAMA